MSKAHTGASAGSGAGRWQFVGEQVEVEYEKQSGLWWPRVVIWRGRRYPIAKVVSHWENHSWEHVPPSQRRWYNQRHRNYFIVATEEGAVFEIYMRRNARRRPWTLARMLSQGEGETGHRQAGEDDAR